MSTAVISCNVPSHWKSCTMVVYHYCDGNWAAIDLVGKVAGSNSKKSTMQIRKNIIDICHTIKNSVLRCGIMKHFLMAIPTV